MEAIAYLQLVQDYESPELPEANLPSVDSLKVSRKVMAAGVTGAALVGGALVQSPAIACGGGGCYPVSWKPVVVRPVVVRPVVFKPVCYQPSCYPQGGHDVSYYPEYGNHYPDYEQSDCNCSGDSGGGGGYDEIAFFPEHPNFLTLGSSGQLVALLQQTLIDQGFDPGPVDGLFGHSTAAAVADFQAAAGLQVDGIAGGQTLDALGLAGAGA